MEILFLPKEFLKSKLTIFTVKITRTVSSSFSDTAGRDM